MRFPRAAAAAAAGLLVVTGWLLWPRTPAVHLAGASGAGPVILIPGYGGGTDGLAPLAAALTASGRQVLYAPVGDVRGDLREYGRRVAEQVRDLTSRGAPSVDLVGYSAGGLIARAAVSGDPQAAAAVRRVVTVASPHHGTQLAKLGAIFGSAAQCPTACQQMAPGSELLDSLPDAGDPTRWLALWTSADEVVTPGDSGALPGATSFDVSTVCTAGPLDHSTVMTAAATVRLTVAFLDTGQALQPC